MNLNPANTDGTPEEITTDGASLSAEFSKMEGPIRPPGPQPQTPPALQSESTTLESPENKVLNSL